jgi:hypothetical protein
MNKFLVAVFFLTTSFLALGQDIFKKEDKFTGSTHFFTKPVEVELEGGSFFSRRYVYLDIHGVKPSAKPSAPYFLTIRMETPDWVFVPQGESLLLKIDDGEITRIFGDGGINSRQIQGPSNVSEIVSYPVTRDLLQRIGQAKKVEFRVVGQRQTVTGAWAAQSLLDAAEFAKVGPTLMDLNGTAGLQQAIPTSADAKLPKKLGIQFVAVTQEIAAAAKINKAVGVIVVAVAPNSVAEQAGIAQF